MIDFSQERVLILASEANDLIVSRLIDGAKRALLEAGIGLDQQSLFRVPGALELPLALKKFATHFDMFVVLGVVLKGQTDHYDHVSRMAFEGVMRVALDHSLALGNGIMTVHTMELALARADGPQGNLGKEAAKAAVSLRQLFLSQPKNTL